MPCFGVVNSRIDLDVHVKLFRKTIQANGGKKDDDIVNFCFTLKDLVSN
jgi:hypothetical protein